MKLINIFKSKKKDFSKIIEEIHNEFDTASERILNEAKEIIVNSDEKIIEKSERLQKLGFTQSKHVTIAKSVKKSLEKNKFYAEKIIYYKQWYPNYKFITEEEVNKICEKYGLIFGNVSDYIGNIPEKNLIDIEKFELRKEDYKIFSCKYYKYYGNGIYIYSIEGEGDYGYVKYNRLGYNTFHAIKDTTQKYVYEKDRFMICASKNDFNTDYMTITNGYKLEKIPDPIVLQPVEGGYLIVTKWGLEAQDESLVNEKLN